LIIQSKFISFISFFNIINKGTKTNAIEMVIGKKNPFCHPNF